MTRMSVFGIENLEPGNKNLRAWVVHLSEVKLEKCCY